MRLSDVLIMLGFIAFIVLFTGPVFWSSSNESLATTMWRKLTGKKPKP